MLWDEPRSTSSHCGSENALDHRVPVFPSVASAAGVPAFSVEEAVVGWPCDSSVLAAWAWPVLEASSPATRASTVATASRKYLSRRRPEVAGVRTGALYAMAVFPSLGG